MDVKVLGAGCANCNKLYEVTTQAIAQTGVQAKVTKVEDFKDIALCGVMAIPALVIDGEVKSAGKIPELAEVFVWLTTAAARESEQRVENA